VPWFLYKSRSADVRFEAGQLFEHLRHRWNRRSDAQVLLHNPFLLQDFISILGSDGSYGASGASFGRLQTEYPQAVLNRELALYR